MINNVEEMLCFAAICKTGTFTEASSRLGCSKSHISRKVSDLETRIGVKLFHRTTRRIFLTEAGEKLKVDAIGIYEKAIKLDNQARDIDGKVSGRFVITAPVSISTFLIAPLIPKLHKTFPDIHFDIIPTNENLKVIEEGIDLAIRSGSVVDENLVAKHLANVSNAFFTSSVNTEKYSQLTLSELVKLPLLLNSKPTESGTINVFESGKPVCVSPKNSLVVREFPIIANTLFDSEYIGWLPEYCANYQHGGSKLVRLLNSVSGPEWPVYLAFAFQTPLPVKLNLIVQFFQQELANKL